MSIKLQTPYGKILLEKESPQLINIQAESDCGAYFAQGYAAARWRLWQLELTRRVAAGELSELFGPASLATDQFQRNLGLRTLAQREFERDAGSAQAMHVQVYTDGINAQLEKRNMLPIEFLMLRHTPQHFTPQDVYLVAQLKYFINSAWQFELLHTMISGHIGSKLSAQLFTTFSEEGHLLPPLPRDADGEIVKTAADTLAAGLAGLKKLGLSSPDIGSNAFAVNGSHTTSGFPLLAADPHMGHVNPGFNLLCKLRTDEGLNVFGSNFPGGPGIIVGRNKDCGWGLVGLMADNQDLLVGKVEESRVRILGDWEKLYNEENVIKIRGAAPVTHIAKGYSGGRLLYSQDNTGLFFRWPALDSPLGGISFNKLSRAKNWEEFREGLSEMTNAPMMAVYADRHNNIGQQAVGLFPMRQQNIGSLVLSLDDPAHQIDGYIPYNELPSAFNPKQGQAIYANQYTEELFSEYPHLSNRWHPPSRVHRIAELLKQKASHTANDFMAIQDDRIDVYARDNLQFWLSFLDNPDPLQGWSGDTRDTECALLFDRWIAYLLDDILSTVLPAELKTRYADLWPPHRWNLLNMLKHHISDWPITDLRERINLAYMQAQKHQEAPQIAFSHSLRQHPLAKFLFMAAYPYDGGSRETIHTTRRNTDFLTGSQTTKQKGKHFNFGPSFKFVYDFSPAGAIAYQANMPVSGNPLGVRLVSTLRRWRHGKRYITTCE